MVAHIVLFIAPVVAVQFGVSREAFHRTLISKPRDEGIADYVRWFLYEPESHGAEITGGRVANARHDASYRVSANFLDWVTKRHDSTIVAKLNAAAREGLYSEKLWQEHTGLTLPELAADWKAELQQKDRS